MQLRITDGTTTIILNDSTGTPTSPFVGAVYFPRDPGSQERVPETARVGFSGVTTTLRTAVNNLERLLSLASDPRAPILYVEYSPNAGTTYRSPVYGGRVVWAEEKSLRQMGESSTSGELAVIFERANYWEGGSVTLAAGTIVNGTGSPQNYISLGTPTGTLPAPLNVQALNASGTGIFGSNYYFNVDSYAGLTSTQHLLTSPSTLTTADGDVKLLAISSAIIAKFAGQDAQILVALNSSPGAHYMRAMLYSTVNSIPIVAQRGNERHVVNGQRLIDLGSLPIPPGGEATHDLSVGIGAYPGSVILDIAFVQIMPAAGALRMRQIGYSLLNGSGVYEDGTKERAYAIDSSSKYEIIRRSGGPLMVVPGRVNRLTMLMDEASGLNFTRQYTLSATYRPRRATI